MKQRHSVVFDIDAAASETAEGTVTLDGVEYYFVATPTSRLRTLRGGGSIGLGGVGKTAVNLGPLGGPQGRCPLCGK